MTNLLIIVAVLAIYSRSLNGEFLTDDAAIKDMEELNGKFRNGNYLPRLSWNRLSLILRRSPRAVTHFTYHWTWKLFGFRPWAWHAGNILIHLCSTFLLWKLFTLHHWPYASLATAAFAVHPLQVPAVSWISGRAGMLAAMFGYLGWVLLVLGYWPLAIVAQLLAWKSKEEGILYLLVWPFL